MFEPFSATQADKPLPLAFGEIIVKTTEGQIKSIIEPVDRIFRAYAA